MANKKKTEGADVELDDDPQIPGLEDKKDGPLIQLAADYHYEMTKRIAASKKEKAAKNLVIAAMKEREIQSYRYKGVIVIVSATDNLKVKVPEQENE